MEDCISVRTSKEDLYNRELMIQSLMKDGVACKAIFETVAKEFRVSTHTVKRHYYDIVKEMMSLAKENRDELRTNLMARNDEIYKKSMQEAKYKTALDANMAQAKLCGLFEEKAEQNKPPEVITITEADFSGNLKMVNDESD